MNRFSRLHKKLTIIATSGVSLWRLARDPNDTQQVFRLIDPFMENAELFESELATMYRRSRLLPAWRPLYLSGYRPEFPSMEDFSKLPKGSLGQAYLRFMQENKLHPDFYPPVPRHREDLSAYIEDRVRRSHDFWHVLTGNDTSLIGELGVQAFGLKVLRSPIPLAIIAAGLLRTILLRPFKLRQLLQTLRRSYRSGTLAEKIVTFRFEENWHRPLIEIQRELGIAI